jgi:hypothetical protein
VAEKEDRSGVNGCLIGNEHRVGALLFAVLLLCYAYVHQGPNHQIARTRLDLLYSLVLHGEVHIDRYHQNTSNKAVYGGHYYSDKAPLTVMIALPAFAAAIAIEKGLGIDPESPRGWEISSWIASVGSLGLLTALGGLIAFRLLLLWVDVRSALICSLAIYLGAAPFPYATALYSHGLTASLLTFALYLFFIHKPGGPSNSESPSGTPHRNGVWICALCGMCCGLALAAEYSSGLVGLFITLACLKFGFKKFAAASLGALAGAAPVPLYHALCFKNPFAIAYQHEAHHFAGMREGFFGIHFPPSGELMLRQLFGLDFGLFAWTPLLLLSFVGYIGLFRESRIFGIGSLCACFLHLSAIAGYTYLFTSTTVAARLLAPLLPLLIVPTALGVSRFPTAGLILAGLSVLFTGGATLVSIGFSGAANPLVEFYWPALMTRDFAPNLGGALGLPDPWSLVPLLFIASMTLVQLLRLTTTPDAPCGLPTRQEALQEH